MSHNNCCKSREDFNQSGFTLVETIVVLTIAVMMIGLGATIYSNYTENIQSKRTADEIKSVGYAYKTYLSSIRLDIINDCEQGGNISIGNLSVSSKEDNQCYLSMTNMDALRDYMPSGIIPPEKTPYKQRYNGRGVVKLNTSDIAKSVITPLVITGNLNGSGVQLDQLTASRITQLADANTGFTYSRNGKIKAGGNTLFDIMDINKMAQTTLPEGVIFYTGGALGVESELGYLDQQTADQRYLVRDEILNHPEYNKMNTNLNMQNNMVITQGGVEIQPTVGLKEGDKCNDNEYIMKRTELGYLVQCQKTPGKLMLHHSIQGISAYSIPNMSNAVMYVSSTLIEKIKYFNDVLYNSEPLPSFWRYVSPDEVPDNAYFFDSHDYISSSSTQRFAIRVPNWYPYGKVHVCPVAYKKNDVTLVSNAYLQAIWGNTDFEHLVEPLYNKTVSSDQIYTELSGDNCFDMVPGELLPVTGYVNGFVIRYKGNILPAFIRGYSTSGDCAPLGDPSDGLGTD